MASCGDHCVLATRLDDEEVQGNAQCKFGLILCNALGTPVDSKYVNMEPCFVAMTSSHVITASENAFILWHYRTPRSQTLDITGNFTHIHRIPRGVTSKLIIPGIKRENKEKIYRMKTYLTPDSSVCSLTARDNVLIFGTELGHVVGFDLPSVNHVGSVQLPFKPTRLALNSNAT